MGDLVNWGKRETGSAKMWQGIVDSHKRIRVFNRDVGQWRVSLYRQYTGDAYGFIGDDSWRWELTVVRGNSA